MDNTTSYSTHWLTVFSDVPSSSLSGKSQTTVPLIIILILLLALLLMKIIKRVQRYRKSEIISTQVLDEGRALVTQVLLTFILIQQYGLSSVVDQQPKLTKSQTT